MICKRHCSWGLVKVFCSSQYWLCASTYTVVCYPLGLRIFVLLYYSIVLVILTTNKINIIQFHTHASLNVRCTAMYSVFRSCRQKTHLHCLNSYNYPFDGKHNADMALSENEFDNLLQCCRMSESRDKHCIWLAVKWCSP